MPSDLQVSNIKDLTGSNTGLSIASDGQVTISQDNPTVTLHATGDSSSTNTTFPKGHVLQTISVNFETETSVTDNSYVIINSNFKVDITPSSTSNKILVMYTIPAFSDRINATYSTTIFRSISGGTSNTNIGSATHGFGVTVSNAGSVASGQSAVFLDSPNTTSAVTYQPVHKETSTGVGYACINSSKATLTCMEIKQ